MSLNLQSMNINEALPLIQFALKQGLKIAIIYCRVSTSKQADEGDSWEDQEKVCRLSAERQGYYVIRVFYESYTGTKIDRPVWHQLLTFCKQLEGFIHAVFVRDLDRFNRDGVTPYQTLKGQLAQYSVSLKDVPGIVQPPQNALDHLGLKYGWSCFSSSEMAEVVKNQADTEDRRRILIRLIGAEISLVRKGYWTRPAPHGFLTAKAEDIEGKKRTILVPDPHSSHWYETIYELSGISVYSDQHILDHVNNQRGFRTPMRKRHDPVTGTVIGKEGGKTLTLKEMRKRRSRVIYAGFICEKWTNYKLIKAQFQGLVSLETWNEAQRGKQKIVKIGDEYKLIKHDDHKAKSSYRPSNPQFPYKALVRCPVCDKPLMASASTGKGGKRYPAYHCDRNHKRFAVSGSLMQEAMQVFFQTLQYKPNDLKLFEMILRDHWKSAEKKYIANAEQLRDNIEKLEMEKKGLVEKIKQLNSQVVIAEFESEIEDLELKIAHAKENHHKPDVSENEIESLIHYAKYFLEHLDKWFEASHNRKNLDALFRLIFLKPPTYEEIQNGTPILRHYLANSRHSKTSKSFLVDRNLQSWKIITNELRAIKSFLVNQEDLSC